MYDMKALYEAQSVQDAATPSFVKRGWPRRGREI